MPQPNSTGVDASKQKKNKNRIKHYWTDREYKDGYVSKVIFHYTKPPQLKLDKPVPALKTINLTKPGESDLVSGLLPPKPTLVNLVDGSSPHVPSITTKVSNENLLNNSIGKTDANTASTTTPNTALKTNSSTTTPNTTLTTTWNRASTTTPNTALTTTSNTVSTTTPNTDLTTTWNTASTTTPNTALTTTWNTASTTTPNTALTTTSNTVSTTTPNTDLTTTWNTASTTTLNTALTTTWNTASTSTPNIPSTTTASTDQESSDKMGKKRNAAKKNKNVLAARQAILEAAGQPNASPAIQLLPEAPHIYVVPKFNHPTDPTRTYTNQQKKKWLNFQKKLVKKNVVWKGPPTSADQPVTLPEEAPLPETSQDGSPSVIGQTSESPSSVSTDGSSQGSSRPILQKPNITLKTKKSLQQDMVKQRLNWIKPADSDPGTSTSSSQDSPQAVEAPRAPLLPDPVPGSSRTSTSSSQDSPQAVEAPRAPLLPDPVPGPSWTSTFSSQTVGAPRTPLLPDPVPGSTIPRLENRAVEPTPRTNAGSFFKKSAPTQPPQPSPSKFPMTHARGFDLFNKYPKGIPKSFLLQQERSMEASGAPITADSPIWPSNPMMNSSYPNAITLGQQQPPESNNPATSPILVQTDNAVDVQQPYSPSDIYSEQGANPEPPEDDAESSEQNQAGQKRLSAFQRLGPVSQPKKPKLTINLNLKKDQPVREVVNETDDDPDKYTPVHLRKDMMESTDETVVKYLPAWPWRKNIAIRRSATARNSRSVMILEQEKMEEAYDKENIYIQISVKGYPSTWTKERVLDAVLDSVKGYSLIPCFIEFTQHECKFLVLRSRSALIVLHKTGFYIHKDGVELTVTISLPILPDKLDFIPRIIIRKRIIMGFMDRKLNLSALTLQNDISHFIYFPLNRLTNQRDCIQLQTSIDWNRLVELNLSHNRLTTIAGFDFINVMPNLKHLNLSHNLLEKVTVLLSDRLLPLKTIHLEGNPLCHDYIDPEHYVKVIRMMFPAVVEIDGVPIHRKGELPTHKLNYCPEEAQEVAEKFLEIYFPLLDAGSNHRSLVQGMYDDDATLTITYCYKLRYGPIFRNFRNLFLYARFLDEGETDSVVGAMAITKLINRWPHTDHDPSTFSLDVLYHTETTTILRVSGILKLTAETLAEDEHLLSFTRTVVLYSEDETEYKIQNEMVYWSEPSAAAARSAFKVTTVSQKNYNLKIEATTDEYLRDKFLKMFMKLTTMDKKISERCLEINDWNFKLALERFTKLLKLKNLDSLTQEVQATS